MNFWKGSLPYEFCLNNDRFYSWFTWLYLSNIVTEQRNWPRSVFCWLKSCWSLKYLSELRIFATMFTDHSVSGNELTRDVWWAWSVSRAGPWCGDTDHSDPGIMKQSCVHILVKPPESVIIRVTRVRQSYIFFANYLNYPAPALSDGDQRGGSKMKEESGETVFHARS